MKTITLTNGMVIFVEQIAFIHLQPSSTDAAPVPELHAHFAAGLTTPKGSRSMRVVIAGEQCGDFVAQLERHGVDCTHLRARLKEFRPAA